MLLGFLQQASFDPPSCRGFRQRAKMGRLALMVVGNISGERPREHFFHPIVSTLIGEQRPDGSTVRWFARPQPAGDGPT